MRGRVALGDIHLQTWFLATSTCNLRGRHGTCGAGLLLVARLVRLALRSPRLIAWQVWHLATSTFTLGGSRGPCAFVDIALCVAGVALMALGWLRWRVFGALVAVALCVAGAALGDIHLHFTWQARHLLTSACTLRGRRGAFGAGLALVARLVPWSPRLFAWQGGTW